MKQIIKNWRAKAARQKSVYTDDKHFYTNEDHKRAMAVESAINNLLNEIESVKK